MICCLMETVDDTVLMKKAIVSELTADLWAMMSHKSARLCLLHLLAPRAPRYQPTHLLHCLPVLGDDGMPLPITLVGEMAKAQGKKRARKDDDDDEGEREKDGEEEAEEEEEGEEEGEAGGEKEQLAGGVKKPFEVKRRELLGGNGGLGEMLVRLLLPRECVLVARAPSGEAPRAGHGAVGWCAMARRAPRHVIARRKSLAASPAYTQTIRSPEPPPPLGGVGALCAALVLSALD